MGIEFPSYFHSWLMEGVLDPLIVLSYSIIQQASEFLELGEADHHPLGPLLLSAGPRC